MVNLAFSRIYFGKISNILWNFIGKSLQNSLFDHFAFILQTIRNSHYMFKICYKYILRFLFAYSMSLQNIEHALHIFIVIFCYKSENIMQICLRKLFNFLSVHLQIYYLKLKWLCIFSSYE